MPVSYKIPGKSLRRNVYAAVSVAGLLAIGGTSGAKAITPNVMSEVGHFVECFGWMITDPNTHADNCLPGHIPPLESLVDHGPGEERASPPPPPPPPSYPSYPSYPGNPI